MLLEFKQSAATPVNNSSPFLPLLNNVANLNQGNIGSLASPKQQSSLLSLVNVQQSLAQPPQQQQSNSIINNFQYFNKQEWISVPCETFQNAVLFIDPKKPQQKGLLYSRFAFKAIQHLVQMIVDEYWGTKLSLLKKYLNDTFVRLAREEKVLIYASKEENFHVLLWNTGLLTKQNEFVYCIMIPHLPLKDGGANGNGAAQGPEGGAQVGEDSYEVELGDESQQLQVASSGTSSNPSTPRISAAAAANMQVASHHIKGFFPDHKVQSIVQAMLLERLQDVRNYSEVATPFPLPVNYVQDIPKELLVYNAQLAIDPQIPIQTLLGATPLLEEQRREVMPAPFKDLSKEELVDRIRVALPTTIKRLMHNPRTSVPLVRVNSLGYIETVLLAPINLLVEVNSGNSSNNNNSNGNNGNGNNANNGLLVSKQISAVAQAPVQAASAANLVCGSSSSNLAPNQDQPSAEDANMMVISFTVFEDYLERTKRYRIQELIPAVEAYEAARVFSSIEQQWLLRPLPPHPKILKAQEKAAAAAAQGATPKLSPRDAPQQKLSPRQQQEKLSPRDAPNSIGGNNSNKDKIRLNNIPIAEVSISAPNSARRK